MESKRDVGNDGNRNLEDNNNGDVKDKERLHDVSDSMLILKYGMHKLKTEIQQKRKLISKNKTITFVNNLNINMNSKEGKKK